MKIKIIVALLFSLMQFQSSYSMSIAKRLYDTGLAYCMSYFYKSNQTYTQQTFAVNPAWTLTIHFHQIEKKSDEVEYQSTLTIPIKVGEADFTYYRTLKSALLHRLIIAKEFRHKKYGSLFYALIIQKLLDLGAQAIWWEAHPFDLEENQNIPGMLPRLITFYGQLGAVLKPSPSSNTLLEITDIPKARQGIAKIIEKFRRKYSNYKNK